MNTQNSTRSFLAGFNLNSLLLLIVISLLAVVAFKPAPSPVEVYDYRATRITGEVLARALKIQNEELYKKEGRKVGKASVNWPTSHIFPDDTEYVGFLCNDGPDAAWILVRWPKK